MEKRQVTTLPNGIRIVTEHMADIQQVAIRCTMKMGSQNDPEGLSGLAHFLEHALFLGTPTRTEDDIEQFNEHVGNLLNAETDYDSLSLTGTVVPEDATKVLELFADMIQNPTFPADLVAREKKIIQTEIAQSRTDYRDGLMFLETTYAGSPLGNPVAGYVETVEPVTPEILQSYHQAWFRPENMIISVSGAVNHEAIVQLCNKLFENFKNDTPQPKLEESKYVGGFSHYETDFESDTFRLGFEGVHLADRKAITAAGLYGLMLSNTLYDELRTKKGLLYSIGAGHDCSAASGVFGIVGMCEPQKLKTIMNEVCRIVKQSAQYMTPEKLADSKKQYKLGLPKCYPMERTVRNASQLFYFDKLFLESEAYARINSIGMRDILAIADKFMQSTPTFVCVGHKKTMPTYEEIKQWLQPDLKEPKQIIAADSKEQIIQQKKSLKEHTL